ncbi:MAG: DUF3017 domain-containing protein [Propioniciclava sp.]
MTEPHPAGPESRLKPWYRLLRLQWPLALVLTGVGAGLLWAGIGHWKRGSFLIGVSFLLATGLRAALPDATAGLLRVRNRVVDTVCLAGLGVGIVILSLVVPPAP